MKIFVLAATVAALTACAIPVQRSYPEVQSAQAVATSVASLPPGTYGDGDYVVGSDIVPGTYHTTGPDPDSAWPMCYWARVKGMSGELKDIIANSNIKGASTIVIKPTDGGILFHNGCYWTKK